MIGADLSKRKGEKYVCPECEKLYTWRWIRRHLVKDHGYKYWDSILYDPSRPENEPLKGN